MAVQENLVEVTWWVEEVSAKSIYQIRQMFYPRPYSNTQAFEFDLSNRMYLLQKGLGVASLDFDWTRYTSSMRSHALDRTIQTIADPNKDARAQLDTVSRYKPDSEGWENVKKARLLFNPPAEYTGKCAPVWVEAEAAALWITRLHPQEAVSRTLDQLVAEGYPKKMAHDAYMRLIALGALEVKTAVHP